LVEPEALEQPQKKQALQVDAQSRQIELEGQMGGIFARHRLKLASLKNDCNIIFISDFRSGRLFVVSAQ
jgi:hypothetical protein